MLKYVSYDIVFQEIPDEVTLTLHLSNCPNRCPGCHSPQLMEDIGEVLTTETLSRLIRSYGSAVTCVCFMGGDADKAEVARLAGFVKSNTDLKTAWYSGRDVSVVAVRGLDYVKSGPYIQELGGLRKRTTNQRLYKVSADGTYEDITRLFWKN